MSQEILSFKPSSDVCEASGCLAKATTNISVKVGELGIIFLRLCNDCASKFGDDSS